MSETFTLEIFTPAKSEVFLACDREVPWAVVRALDAAGHRVVGDLDNLESDARRLRRIMASCSSVVVPAGAASASAVRQARAVATELQLPVLSGAPGPEDLPRVRSGGGIPPYAFMIGRLERDFTHARDALRAAVEGAAGIPLLWIDDGEHRTSVESVRERTRLLIRRATFVIGELTLGVESPDRENPSRAHEIGMAIAYGRPLLLTSQEPRRYPYFSISDLQMTFWDSEADLECQVRSWVRANREAVARRVFNAELPDAVLRARPFEYDPRLRYIGPRTRVRPQ